MTEASLTLGADFPAADEATWRALAEAALKGQPFERLIGRTPDGAAILPLYREPDWPSARDHAGLPGQAPFTRGRTAVRDRFLPWDIRQRITRRQADQANAEALADLRGGVSSLELRCGGGGLGADQIGAALNGVMVDLAPIALDAGHDAVACAAALAGHLRAVRADPGVTRPAFNLDPLSAWMQTGAAAETIELSIASTVAFSIEASREWPLAACLRASGVVAHEAGATPAQELAVMLAAGLEYLRHLEAGGVDPAHGARFILHALAVGPDVIVEIAKLRAARTTWARILEMCGVAPQARAAPLQAIASMRMMTRDDAWTNILRTTAACFAAAAGGADIITIAPLTAALGQPSAQARRIARNTQIVLMEESHLGRVCDPGGGAWAVERMTQDIAEAAWAKFQAIERQGGLIAALRTGDLQSEIAAAHGATMARVARRKQPLTGVTDFPLLDAQAPLFDGQDEAAPQALGADAITALTPRRLAEPFEALRARAAQSAPRLFAATLGPPVDFAPRANFAANVLAAGGLRLSGADTAYANVDAMLAAFRASGCAGAVLCGSDQRYAETGVAAVRALKSNGAGWLLLAGKPDDEAVWRDAGVDQFVFAGQDILAALETLHTALGVTP